MGARHLNCTIEAPDTYQPRARYALEMLLMPLGLSPRWVDRQRLETGEPGIYYGTEDPPNHSRILVVELHPSTIEFFHQKRKYPPRRATWIGETGPQMPALFPLTDRGFDPIASTFFWLSGWQEYTTKTRDQHGRFPYRASLQARWKMAGRPVVEVYRQHLKYNLRSIQVKVEPRTWGGASWALCPTHDIDYLRKWRPGIIYRELVGLCRQNQLDGPPNRAGKVLRQAIQTARTGRDPYRYSWERMQEEEMRCSAGATYFLKTGSHGPYDVDGTGSRAYLKERIAGLLSEGFEVGLHPSYHAATHPQYMERELEDLEELTGGRIRSVRQHYLRFFSPSTARMQANAGLAIDSSMGFAAHEGFRHATCMPFRYYDIRRNRPLGLWLLPLAVMDSTLFGYRGLPADRALQRTLELLHTCKKFGGVCVVLWHNVIYDSVDGHGYDQHFENVLDRARAEGAFVGSIAEAFDRWGTHEASLPPDIDRSPAA